MVQAQFSENLYEITGQTPAADVNHSVRANETHDKQKIDDHNLSMKSDDIVLASGRINPLGKAKRGSGDHDTKAGRRLMEDYIFQQILNDMQRLQALYDELEATQAGIDAIEARVFTPEELLAFENLPEEERLESKRQSFLEKVTRGERTQEEYDEWDKEQATKAAQKASIAEIKEKHSHGMDHEHEKAKSFSEMQRILFDAHQTLLDDRTSLAKNIQGNEQFLNQLDRLKKTGDTSGSNAELIVMLDSRPDLGISFPEDANFEEKIEMIETAVNAQTIDLQREQVEVEEDITKIEAAQETLNVAAPEEQTNEYAQKVNSDIKLTDESLNEVKAESGVNFSFSLASSGENPQPSPSFSKIEDVEETPARDLTGIDSKFS